MANAHLLSSTHNARRIETAIVKVLSELHGFRNKNLEIDNKLNETTSQDPFTEESLVLPGVTKTILAIIQKLLNF